MHRQRALRFAALIATLLTTSCATQPPAPVVSSGCATFGPIYLSEGAITALHPFLADRQAVAEHNRVWRRVCERTVP